MSVLRICKNVSWSETGKYSYYGTITNVDNNILEWHYDLTPDIH